GPAAANPGGFVWTDRWGGNTTVDSASGVVGDAFGNSYIVTDVLGTAVIDQTSITTATQDVVVVKLRPDGGLGWSRVIGGSGIEHGGRIVIDNSGNLYVTGTFGGPMTVAGTTVTPVGVSDQFLVKLDTNGVPKWIKTMGTPTADAPPLVEADNSGSVVLGAT